MDNIFDYWTKNIMDEKTGNMATNDKKAEFDRWYDTYIAESGLKEHIEKRIADNDENKPMVDYQDGYIDGYHDAYVEIMQFLNFDTDEIFRN